METTYDRIVTRVPRANPVSANEQATLVASAGTQEAYVPPQCAIREHQFPSILPEY